jgi:acetolactate synthase-1/2/3 large subunit
MAKLTGGEAIVKSLIANGVDTIFGLPGGQTYALFDAMHGERARLKQYTSRHEQGAGYMAYGYARSTGRVGVYSVVPGPGVLNTGAALATAYGANTPVLCVVGQVPSHGIGRGAGFLHEIPDQLGILQRLTKWAERIAHPSLAPQLVNEAFVKLQTGRPRPVALEMSPDIMEMQAEVDLLKSEPLPAPAEADPDLIKRAAQLLGKAKRPLIVIGGGAIDARAELMEIGQALQAPIMSFWHSKGVIDDRHCLSQSWPAGHRLWAGADAVLAIGTRLKFPQMYWGMDEGLPIVRVDVDPVEITRIAVPAVGIVADARLALRDLIAALGPHNAKRASRQAEMQGLKDSLRAEMQKTIGPLLAILDTIRRELPEDGILVDEITQVGYASWYAFPVYSPRTFVTSGYAGNLGYGYATALGVQAGNPGRKVIALGGDGGFMYQVGELATAARYRLPLLVIVFNNNAFGNVRRDQAAKYDGRVSGSELTNPDFVKLAESFGIAAWRADTPQQLGVALQEALRGNAPALIEVPMPLAETPNPWQYIMLGRCR